MKRSLVLTAAGLGFAAAATAQSSVTLYGLVDLNINHVKSGSGSGTTSLTDGTANGLNGSRWGLRVSEDLGGGLKAGVVIESGLLADTGAAAQGGLAFGRQAFISLSSSSAGELRMGRQYALHDTQQGQSNPFGNGTWLNPAIKVTNPSTASATKQLPMFVDAPRINNVVQYSTPTWGGFGATVQLAPGEGTADRFHGLGASFSDSKMFAGLTYEWNKARSNGENTNKLIQVVGNYNFGPVKLMGGYQRARDLTTAPGSVGALGNLVVTTPTAQFTADRLDAWTLGVSVPVGSKVLLGTNYTRTTYEDAAGTSEDVGRFGVGARYSFSTRTFAYATVATATGGLKDVITEKTMYQVGLRHAF